MVQHAQENFGPTRIHTHTHTCCSIRCVLGGRFSWPTLIADFHGYQCFDCSASLQLPVTGGGWSVPLSAGLWSIDVTYATVIRDQQNCGCLARLVGLPGAVTINVPRVSFVGSWQQQSVASVLFLRWHGHEDASISGISTGLIMMSWNWIFLRCWPFGRGIHRSPVDSAHTGPVTRAMTFFFVANPKQTVERPLKFPVILDTMTDIETIQFRVCEGNPPVTSDSPSQRVSNAGYDGSFDIGSNKPLNN